MTIVNFTGTGVDLPPMPGVTLNPSFGTALTISSANTADKIANIGRVVFAARTGTKNITKVHFRFGTVSKANGSTLKVSLQDVDLANGPVIRPDGTIDQSYTILNADSNFATNAWYTATLDASRTVTYGDLISVVWEWATPVTGDSFIVSGLAISSASSNAGTATQQGVCTLFTASAWTVQNICPNMLFEFSDGTFGTLDGAIVVSALGTTTYNSSSTPDEYCLEFQLPFAAEVDSMWAITNSSTSADFDMVLYNGTTALATVTVDSNAIQQSSAGRFCRVTFPVVSLSANTTYRIAIKPTTTNNITIYYNDVSAENHMTVYPLSTTAQLNSRTDSGSWGTATETRRLWAGIRVSGVDLSLSSSAGGSYTFVG